MSVEFLTALKDIAHELAPWAAVAIAGIGAWQATRGKEYGKQAVEKASVAVAKVEEAIAVSSQNKTKLDEVHKAVNGRMDQQLAATSEVARREGYDQGSADTMALQKVGRDNSEQGVR